MRDANRSQWADHAPHREKEGKRKEREREGDTVRGGERHNKTKMKQQTQNKKNRK